jgi:hypothetical protein
MQMEELQKLMKQQNFGKQGLDDPEQKQFDLKINKTIDHMPEEVQDRFKALKVI